MHMIGLRIARRRRFNGPDSKDVLESGTLIYVNSNITRVQWDFGEIEQFDLYLDSDETRLGKLVVLDNAPAGVSHNEVACNTCYASPLPGIRWRCQPQHHKEYSLCTKCYMSDAPSTNHRFTRILMPNSGSVDVGNRAQTKKVEVNGTFPRAMVVLNSTDATGEVLEVTSYERSANSGIKARWCSPEGGTTICKLGLKGEVDVKCTKAAPDVFYYEKHLSKLHELFLSQRDGSIVQGETVCTCVDEDMLRSILVLAPEEHKKNIPQVSGKFCLVERVTMNEWLVVNFGGYRCKLPHYVFMKVPRFSKGDNVLVMKDEAQFKKCLFGHGGWRKSYQQILGKECRVVKVDEDGDVVVKMNGQEFLVNPVALSRVTSSSPLSASAAMIDIVSEQDKLDTIDRDLMLVTQGSLQTALKMALHAVHWEQLQNALQELRIGSVNDKLEGLTLLHIAAHKEMRDCVELLLRCGADVSIKDKRRYTALHRAACRNVTGDVIKILLNHGADCNVHDEVHGSPLHLAVTYNKIEVVQALLGHQNCDVNLQNGEKDTSLHIAIRNGNRRTSDFLLGHGNVDCSLSNKGGYNALQLAALLGDTITLEAILQHDHNLLNATMTNGFSPLHLAAHENRVEVAKALLQKKCDMNATTKEHLTALHLAASQGHLAMTICLLDAGADCNMKDKDEDTALNMLLLQQVSCTNSWKPSKEVTKTSQMICRYCDKNPAVAFFKPCGHKIICAECVPVQECKECGKGVRRFISPDIN